MAAAAITAPAQADLQAMRRLLPMVPKLPALLPKLLNPSAMTTPMIRMGITMTMTMEAQAA